ncbi:hypothetical protein HK104_001376, partial [Borealophlyctis nickersoniae]
MVKAQSCIEEMEDAKRQENAERQENEVLALEAIYETDFTHERSDNGDIYGTLTVKITCDAPI